MRISLVHCFSVVYVKRIGIIGYRFFLSLALLPAFLLPFEQVVWGSETAAAVSTPSTVPLSSKHPAMMPVSLNKTWQAYHLPHSLSISPLTHLPVLADGQTALPSNANNFHGEWNATVDPRTGNASFTLTLASTLFDRGQSKYDLKLSYSGGAFAHGPDTFGLGPHWTFNVGTEHPSTSEVAGHQTTDITTGDGHGFTMESVRDAHGQTVWRPLRHKLGDVTISGHPGNWTIAMDTGIREHLLNGYEDWEESRDGQRVWFYYDKQGTGDTSRHLMYICAHPLNPREITGNTNACKHGGVWLTYHGKTVVVHGQQKIVLHEGEDGGIATITSITLPPLSSQGIGASRQPAAIDFSYDDQGNRPWLLHRVNYPIGGSVTFLYNAESERYTPQTNGLRTGLGGDLPVVTEQITTQPRSSVTRVPTLRVWYRYGVGGSTQHNYTGYQSGAIMVPGKDNLLDRADSYTYSVTRDNGTTSTTTTYNKYHLPLRVIKVEDLSQSIMARSNQQYLPWKQTTFNQLPPDYSLPLGSRKTLYALAEQGQDSVVLPAKVIHAKKYNDNGQVIWKKDAYGRQTFIQYCPRQGDRHCPVMDAGWPEVTMPEKVIRLPARHSPHGSRPFVRMATTRDPQPAVEMQFNYERLPVAQRYGQGATDHSVSASNTLGFWQVRSKTVGTLSLASVSGLQPGGRLPDIPTGQIMSQTRYRYNMQPGSPAYGQLTQLRLIKAPVPSPMVNGTLLKVSAAPIPATPRQQITFNVRHKINPVHHTRTTTLSVAHSTRAFHDIKPLHSSVLHSAGSRGLSLGTSVYSLVSGNKLAFEDTLKTMHSVWTYDIWGRPIKKVVTPETKGQPHITRWSYIMTPQEFAVVKTLPNGCQEKVNLSMGNKVLATWHRFAHQANAPMGGVSNWIPDTATTYTQTGKVASKTVYHALDPVGNRPGKTLSLTTFYGYDALNRQTWVRHPDGVVNITVRNDPAMQVIRYKVASATNTHQEQLGPMLAVIRANVLGKPVARYVLPLTPTVTKDGKPVYSPALQARLMALRARLQPVSSLQRHNSYGLLPAGGDNGVLAFVAAAIAAGAWYTRVTTTYDGNGRRIKQVQGNGATTRWQWQDGHLVATITPDGRVIHDTFNVRGKKVDRCVQPAGSTVCHTLGTRGYDSEGNLVWQADERGNLIRYTYDGDGRRLSMSMPAASAGGKGAVFTYTYNSFGETSADMDGTPYVKYTYNPTTWQLTDKEDAISHLHYQYSPNSGRLIRITRSAPTAFTSPAGIDYPTGTTTIRYNRYNQPTTYTDSEGDIYTAVHDHLGRIIQRWVHLPGQTHATLLASTTYDAFGRPHTATNGMGITRTFSYNRLGQLAKTVDSRNGQPFQQLAYTYDSNTGNILTFTRKEGTEEGTESATQTYTYDLSDNLTAMTCSVTGRPGATSRLCPRDTDLAGSSLIRPPIITAQHYTFDSWNNIKAVTETVVTMTGQTTTKTMTYNYAFNHTGTSSTTEVYDPNQMTGFTTTWANQRYSAVPKTLTYDRLGRIIKDAAGDTLHYNAFGQQDGFTNAQTGEYTHYTYDSSGHQVAEQPFASAKQQQALQAPLYMLYSGNRITAQAQEDAHHHLHTSVELGGVAHSEDGVITRWYLHDYKGDVLNTFSSQGRLLSDNVYSPYGMQYNRLSTTVQSLPAMLQLKNQTPWWQRHLPGFDNQMQDPATGYQFLGGGYRAYNPVYRHFMSKDSFSPFRKIDGYGFGTNNPIMNVDPTGHSSHIPTWLGYTVGSLGIVMSIVLALLFPVTAALSAIATGAEVSTEIITGSTFLAGASAILGVSSGTLQIASTAHPDKTLARVNEGFSLTNGLLSIVMGIAIAGIIGVRSTVLGVSKLVSAFIVISSVNTVLSGLSQITGSAMRFLIISGVPPYIDEDNLKESAKVLAYITMGLAVITIISGLGILAGTGGKYAIGRIFDTMDTANAGHEQTSYPPGNDLELTAPSDGRTVARSADSAQAQPALSSLDDQAPSLDHDTVVQQNADASHSQHSQDALSSATNDSQRSLPSPLLSDESPSPPSGVGSPSATAGAISPDSPEPQAVLPSITNQEEPSGETIDVIHGKALYQETLF